MNLLRWRREVEGRGGSGSGSGADGGIPVKLTVERRWVDRGEKLDEDTGQVCGGGTRWVEGGACWFVS
ncbi:hypothetical protein COP2_038680 [Malus domestica]